MFVNNSTSWFESYEIQFQREFDNFLSTWLFNASW